MALFGGGGFGAAQAQEVQDAKLPGAPNEPASFTDGITQVSVSANNLVLGSSWDTTLRVWQVQRQGQQLQGTLAGQAKHDAPALCSCFNGDGSGAFSGGADNTVRMWQFGGSAGATVIGRHDQPVKAVHWIPNLNLVATASWDASVRFWDTRSPTEALKIPLTQKCYAMDVQFPLMAVATAETGGPSKSPMVHLYSLEGAAPQLFQNAPIATTLKHQARCISVFNNQRQGVAVGSVEGRVEIKDLGEMAGRRSFAFKCHRHEDPSQARGGKKYHNVYPVNAICFNSQGTFATAGADGVFNFWDKETKQRLKEFKPGQGCRMHQATQPPNAPPQPITSACFSPHVDLFAYASSYDWSRGNDANLASRPNDIYVHALVESDLKIPPPKR